MSEAIANPLDPETAEESSAAHAPAQKSLVDSAEDSGLRFQLDQFEGPLDLLLSLIRKHQIDIRDIPIARITEQYLDYLKKAEELNLDLGGEFVLLAATLIHIKSKVLLPADPSIPEEERVDPREELVQMLVEHEQFIEAAHMLKQKRVVEENVWSNPPLQAYLEQTEEPGLEVSLFDLVSTFEKVLERAKNRPNFEVSGEDVSVASRVTFLKNLLLTSEEPLTLSDIFERQNSRRALIATFLAVLEMVRMQAVLLRQSELFGDIVLVKHKMFDVVFDDQGLFAPHREFGE